jgi:hypothetical protein
LPRDPIFSKLGGKHRISQAAAQKRAAQIKRLPGRKTASAGGLGKPQGDERGDLLHQLFAKPQLVKSGVTSPDASWLGWLVLFPELAEKFSNEANRSNVCDNRQSFCARLPRGRGLCDSYHIEINRFSVKASAIEKWNFIGLFYPYRSAAFPGRMSFISRGKAAVQTSPGGRGRGWRRVRFSG